MRLPILLQLLILILVSTATAGRVVLVSPSLWYSQGFVRLIEEGVFPLEDPQLQLFIQQDSNHAAEEIRAWLAEEPRPWVQLLLAECLPARSELFQSNACTKQFREVSQEADAILFLGGDDLPPAVYGEECSLLTRETNPHRHSFELSFMYHLLGRESDKSFQALLEDKPDLSVVGFCLGLQTMNVALGGTLVQDIPSELYGCNTVEEVLALPEDCRHRSYHRPLDPQSAVTPVSFHHVRFASSSQLPAKRLSALGVSPGEVKLVLSYHHQAIGDLAPGLIAAAHSTDGKVVEAVYHKRFMNVFATQYHMEYPDLFFEDEDLPLLHAADTDPMSHSMRMKMAGSQLMMSRFWSGLAERIN